MFTIPVDSISPEISGGASLFDCLLWPDLELFQFSLSDTEPVSIDLSATGTAAFDEQDISVSEVPLTPSLGPDLIGGISVLSKLSSTPSNSRFRSLDLTLGQKGLEEYLHEFEGGPTTAQPQRKRRRFSSERRKEVCQMRKVGACVRCKLTKYSVSFLDTNTSVPVS